MSVQGFDYLKIISNGWMQGSCVVVDEQALVDKNNILLKKGLYIVISQDCDVVNSDLSKEPFVELLYIAEIEKCEGTFTNGKNPRKMHFWVESGTSKKHYECIIHEKIFFPRENLEKLFPHEKIVVSDDNLEMFKRWLVSHYNL